MSIYKKKNGVKHDEWFDLLFKEEHHGRIRLLILAQEHKEHKELEKHSHKNISTKIKFVSAQNLPAADLNGLSDPYVKSYLTDNPTGKRKRKQQEWKTKHIEKTLNPVWDSNVSDFHSNHNESVWKFHTTDASLFAVIEVWDHDMIGSDDLLCTLSLSYADIIHSNDLTYIPFDFFNARPT